MTKYWATDRVVWPPSPSSMVIFWSCAEQLPIRMILIDRLRTAAFGWFLRRRRTKKRGERDGARARQGERTYVSVHRTPTSLGSISCRVRLLAPGKSPVGLQVAGEREDG